MSSEVRKLADDTLDHARVSKIVSIDTTAATRKRRNTAFLGADSYRVVCDASAGRNSRTILQDWPRTRRTRPTLVERSPRRQVGGSDPLAPTTAKKTRILPSEHIHRARHLTA